MLWIPAAGMLSACSRRVVTPFGTHLLERQFAAGVMSESQPSHPPLVILEHSIRLLLSGFSAFTRDAAAYMAAVVSEHCFIHHSRGMGTCHKNARL